MRNFQYKYHWCIFFLIFSIVLLILSIIIGMYMYNTINPALFAIEYKGISSCIALIMAILVH